MRYRLMATYRGAPYEAGIGPGDGDITLFAACPPPEELGFGPATGHWRKQLRIEEVQSVWESRPVGKFRGERCLVLDDMGERLHIGYLGHDGFRAEQLGYRQIDRGVFELMAPRDEVTDIVEERTDYPRGGDTTGQFAAVRPGQPLPAAGVQHSGPIRTSEQTGPMPAVQHSGPIRVSGQTGPIPTVQHSGPIRASGQTGPSPAVHQTGPIPAVHQTGPIPAVQQTGPIPAVQTGPIPAVQTGPIPAVQHSGPIRTSGQTGPIPPVQHTGPTPVVQSGPVPGTAQRRPAGASGQTGPITAAQRGAPPAPPAAPPAAQPAPSAVRPVPPADPLQADYQPQPGYQGGGGAATAVSATGVAMPAAAEAPLPLEAAAMEAAAASRRRRRPAGQAAGAQRRRAAARTSADTQLVFADLAQRAAIPADSYALGTEVDGRMCLVRTQAGFEVFSVAGGAKHEVRLFTDEESAYFYLFGVLAAEAVRTGRLIPGASQI